MVLRDLNSGGWVILDVVMVYFMLALDVLGSVVEEVVQRAGYVSG